MTFVVKVTTRESGKNPAVSVIPISEAIFGPDSVSVGVWLASEEASKTSAFAVDVPQYPSWSGIPATGASADHSHRIPLPLTHRHNAVSGTTSDKHWGVIDTCLIRHPVAA